MRLISCVMTAVAALGTVPGLFGQQLTLPNKKDGSVKFLVLGDAGTGGREQNQVAEQMERYRKVFPYDFAIMLGDNIYGAERPQDFEQKFSLPYKALLDAKVEFHAALGNHDDPNQRYFKPFHLDGQRYRTFTKGNIRFFVIDSNYLDPDQLKWLEKELSSSNSDWKIPYFHHPLYSNASRHGSSVDLRLLLEPIFLKYGVQVVFSGHDHVYERLKPQKGIYYFVSGAAGQLRKGNMDPSDQTAASFDQDQSFMLVEVAGDEMFFESVSRTGRVVDSGVINRQRRPSN